jgi:hypothetical protein
MKTVEMVSDFDYRPHPRMTIRFLAGVTYVRVLEFAAREIERAGAGRVVSKPSDAAGLHDASNAYRFRRKRK